MNSDRPVAESEVVESEVVEGATGLPDSVSDALGLEDGDRLRWTVVGDDSVRVEVRRQGSGTFADFTGYDGKGTSDATSEHDEWGLE